jgi:hypothetical protein
MKSYEREKNHFLYVDGSRKKNAATTCERKALWLDDKETLDAIM